MIAGGFVNDLGLMNENNQKARCVIVTEMRYGFKLKEFNETNRRSIEYCIEKSRHNLRIDMARPDSFPFKKELLERTKRFIDAYQWYLDVYDEVMAEKAKSKSIEFPVDYFDYPY